jgi:hypothetical protein
MKRVGIACLIGFALVLVFIVALGTFEYKRQYARVTNLCREASSRVEDSHEAISAVRNYRGPFAFPGFFPMLREFELFQHDGYGSNGGWSVEEWTNFSMHVYTVDFSLNEPAVTIICDVYECGAVDFRNCKALGPFYRGQLPFRPPMRFSHA